MLRFLNRQEPLPHWAEAGDVSGHAMCSECRDKWAKDGSGTCPFCRDVIKADAVRGRSTHLAGSSSASNPASLACTSTASLAQVLGFIHAFTTSVAAGWADLGSNSETEQSGP